MLLDQAEHAPKRLRVGLVDRFQNSLAQAFLALSGEEGFFHQFPAAGARAEQQGARNMPPHAADLVFIAERLSQNVKDLVGEWSRKAARRLLEDDDDLAGRLEADKAPYGAAESILKEEGARLVPGQQ